MAYVGAEALAHFRKEHGDTPIDVALLTHARDESDIARILPELQGATPTEIRAFAHHTTEPVWGEIVQTPDLTVGVLFLPMFADEMMAPATRGRCRDFIQHQGVAALAREDVRVACLGGLTASLMQYGRRLQNAAETHGFIVTTGHAATGVSVYMTLCKAAAEMSRDISQETVAVVGMGSVGKAFVNLSLRVGPAPRQLLLVDLPSRKEHVQRIAQQLRGCAPDVSIRTEFTNGDGSLIAETAVYRASSIVSAISSSNVIDISCVAAGTLLVDDSQPYCWSRQQARKRVEQTTDIVPCEAGLFDVSSFAYRGYFPFDFADHGPEGSTTAWCCLTEGLLLADDHALMPTIGEPSGVTTQK